MNRAGTIAFLALLAAFCAALVYLNLISPFWGDDYVYRFVFDARHYYDESFSRLVASWRDIWDSQVAHYLCTNGRFVVHVLAQGFLYAGQGWVWALANTLCLVANVYLLLRVSCPRAESRPAWQQNFLLALALYWLLLPHPGQLFFWLTGSCNYQWAALMVLGFLNLWLLPAPRRVGWLLYPVALLAGNGNEALSLGLALALTGFAAWRHRELTARQFAGLACFLLGTASNAFSPGVAARVAMAGESVSNAGLATRAVNAWEDTAKVLDQWPSLLLVPLAALALSLLPWGRSERRACLLPAALLSLGLAVYVRMLDPRATFGFFLYAFMLALPVVLTLFGWLPRAARLAIGGVLAVSVGMGLLNAAYDIPRFAAYERAIVDEARAGHAVVVPATDPPYSPYNHSTFLVSNSSGMHNRALASYFGVPRFGVFKEWERRQLQAVPQEAYASLRQPGEYCRSTEGTILVRLPNEPVSTLVTGYKSADDEHPEPWSWGGLTSAVVEQGGVYYLLVFYHAEAREEGLSELRLRYIEGHSWHNLSLDPALRRGVLSIK